jgi:hypothetical protein
MEEDHVFANALKTYETTMIHLNPTEYWTTILNSVFLRKIHHDGKTLQLKTVKHGFKRRIIAIYKRAQQASSPEKSSTKKQAKKPKSKEILEVESDEESSPEPTKSKKMSRIDKLQ